MEDSTGARVELESLRGHVGAARAEMAALGSPSEPERTKHVTALSHHLDEMDAALVSQLGKLEAPPARIACPFCGNLIMARATLCGFCWRPQKDHA